MNLQMLLGNSSAGDGSPSAARAPHFSATPARPAFEDNLAGGRGLWAGSLARFLLLACLFAVSHTPASSANGHSAADWLRIAAGGLFVNPQDSDVRVRLTADGLAFTEDGGAEWTELDSPFETGVRFKIVFHPEDPAQFFALAESGSIAAYDGEFWRPILVPDEFTFDSLPPIAVQGGDSPRILLGSRSGLLIAELEEDPSTDEELTWVWQPVKGLPETRVLSVSIAPSDGSIAVVFEDGRVCLTREDPAVRSSWTAVEIQGRMPRWVTFHPEDSDELLVLLDGSKEILRSLDGGQSWRIASGGGDFSLPAGDPSGLWFETIEDEIRAIVVVDAAVYSTADFERWELLSEFTSEPAVHSGIAERASCSFKVTPTSVSVAAQPATIEVRVDASSSTCTWQVKGIGATSPLKLLSQSPSRGDGRVMLSLAANPSSRSRTIRLSIAGKTVTVKQGGAVNQTPAHLKMGVEGLGSIEGGPVPAKRQLFYIRVEAPSRTTSWRFTSDRDMIRFTPTSGLGARRVRVEVRENISYNRSIQTTFDSKMYKLEQLGKLGEHPTTETGVALPPCKVSAAPVSVGPTASQGRLALTVGTSCGSRVELRSEQSFLTVEKSMVMQSESVTFRLDANTGPARIGTIRVIGTTGAEIAGSPVSIRQERAPTIPCKVDLAVTPTSFGSNGGSASLKIQTTGTCSGSTSIVSNQTWARITSSASLVVDSNAGQQSRTAQLTASVGGTKSAPITVSQAGGEPPPPCSFSVSATHIELSGSNRTANIRATASRSDCSLTVGPVQTAHETKDWLTVTKGGNLGTQDVLFVAGAAPLQDREATVVVGGVTIRIVQRGTMTSEGCPNGTLALGLSLNPFPSLGGEGTIDLHAQNSCNWTLELSGSAVMLNWVDPPTGRGNGSIRFRILPNPSSADRSVTVRALPGLNWELLPVQETIKQTGRR